MFNSKICKGSLSDECIKLIEKFQINMKEEENYLNFYTQLKIAMSLDAMTTFYE